MTDEEMLANLNLLTKALSEGSRMRIALEKAINKITTSPSEEPSSDLNRLIGHKMRDATPEERESINKYIESISEPISQPCADYVSRSSLKDIISKLATKGDSRYGRDSIYGEALYDFADEIRALSPEQLQPKTGWISVKDRLPDTIDDVLVTVDYDNVSVGYYRYCRDGSSNKEWYIHDKEYSNDVSAWMPLPTPYVETKEVTQ